MKKHQSSYTHFLITFSVITHVILFFLLGSASLHAQQKMRTLTIYDGLAGESVYDIYRDTNGLTWFATTNGITNYDGNSIMSFSVSEQRSQNTINALTATKDGRIWAGAVSGLYYLDEKKGRFILASDQITERVNDITNVGNIVFAATNVGMWIVDGNNTKQVWLTPNHVSEANIVNDIEKDEKGNIWLLGRDEIYLYDMKNKSLNSLGLSKKANVPSGMRLFSITGDRMFIGTYNDGLFVYDRKTKETTPYLDVQCRVITCLYNDGEYLYVGTDGSGMQIISLQNDQIVKVYDVSKDSEIRLLDNTVYSFLKDDKGVLFFGYFRRGVQHTYHIDELFHCYRTGSFNSADVNVRSMCIDGKVKVLGSRGGLYFIDEERDVVKFFSPEELGGSIVTNVVKHNNMYYCCTFNGGVMRIDPETLTTSRFGKYDELKNGSFGCLTISPDNELWMSGNKGIFILGSNTDEERVYNSRNSHLYNAYANHIVFDRQGRCWISTANGICLYDPVDKTIQNNGFPKGFFSNLTETIGAKGDKDNLVFISTDGIYRTNEELTEYGKVDIQNTIGDVFISQIIYDSKYHNYWIGTEVGLFRFDSNFKETAKFAQETGLSSREFSSNAIYIDNERRLWTGTVNGLYYANLDSIQKYDAGDAPIVASQLRIGRQTADLEKSEEAIKKHIIRITYHWSTQEISFYPIKLNYSDHSGECYEYRIGREGTWRVLKNQERLEIKEGLHIGSNKLQLRLTGQKDYTEYNIQVLPSWAFILEWIGIIIFFIIMIFIYIQRRSLRYEQEENAKLQKQLEETKRKYSRIQISEDEQERLFRRLDNYMKNEKPYLNADLKLSDIAAHLDTSTVKLSQLLNMFVKKNYYDFINQYRLDEFKRRANDKHYANYTLIALAEECGFRRSSFFSTFKKIENVTPTEYIKNIKEG